MDSDNDQETDHKISQKTWKTSLLLQTHTGGHTNKQPNISDIQWKPRISNKTPNGNSNRLWLRISGYQQNQKVFRYHEENERIVDIIQKVSRYHLSSIDDAT